MTEEEVQDHERQAQISTKRSKRSSAHTSKSKTSSPEEVLSLLKSYLEDKLEDKDKRYQEKAKVDKQASKLKTKGIQKQFELRS